MSRQYESIFFEINVFYNSFLILILIMLKFIAYQWEKVLLWVFAIVFMKKI